MLWVARRYLLSPKSHSVVNVIAWVSLVSLLLPVAAVVILLSVFNGFGDMLSMMDRSIEGDLTLRLREGRLFAMEGVDRDALRGVDGVEALSFVSEQSLLLGYQGRSAVVTLRGVDAEYPLVVALDDGIIAGWFDPAQESTLLIGREVASRLGIRSLRGVEIELMSLRSSPLQGMLNIGSESHARATLSGIFGLDEQSDDRYVYSSQSVANQLLGREGVASRVSIKLREGADLERVRAEVLSIVGDRYRVESRGELNPTLYEIVRYEKLGVLLICSFVILLASFTLMGSLSMLIIEKRGEVSTLRAMGASRRSIYRLFFSEGAIIGGVAIVVGVVIGCGVTLAQQLWGFVELPSSSFERIPYPILLQWGDIVVVVAIASTIVVAISALVTRGMLGRVAK